jgi:hypothetical protein
MNTFDDDDDVYLKPLSFKIVVLSPSNMSDTKNSKKGYNEGVPKSNPTQK